VSNNCAYLGYALLLRRRTWPWMRRCCRQRAQGGGSRHGRPAAAPRRCRRPRKGMELVLSAFTAFPMTAQCCRLRQACTCVLAGCCLRMSTAMAVDTLRDMHAVHACCLQ